VERVNEYGDAHFRNRFRDFNELRAVAEMAWKRASTLPSLDLVYFLRLPLRPRFRRDHYGSNKTTPSVARGVPASAQKAPSPRQS